MGTASFLGPAGALVELPPSEAGIQAADQLLGALHQLAGAGAVLQRSGIGGRARSWSFDWSYLTEDQVSALEVLRLRPGPWRLVDGQRRNWLTANQSMCSELTADTTGIRAQIQGTVTSDTTQFRSGVRSWKWNSVTSLSSTGRGVYFHTSSGTIDHTWTAVLPSTQYTFAAYARASATLSCNAVLSWKTTAGTDVSTDAGASTALSTSDWTARPFVTAISPPTAAYATGGVVNTSTPGTTVSFWVDDAMLKTGPLAEWAVGVGTPEVAVTQVSPAYPYLDFLSPSVVLVELSP